MASFNEVILIGNLTADPEVKVTPSGLSVCNFDIAVGRKYTNQGDQKADFIKICTWRKTAEFVGKYARKGNSLFVKGSIQTRNYTNNQGQKVYITEVVADEVQFAGNNSQGNGYGNSGGSYMPSAYQPNATPVEVGDGSDLPF